MILKPSSHTCPRWTVKKMWAFLTGSNVETVRRCQVSLMPLSCWAYSGELWSRRPQWLSKSFLSPWGSQPTGFELKKRTKKETPLSSNWTEVFPKTLGPTFFFFSHYFHYFHFSFSKRNKNLSLQISPLLSYWRKKKPQGS